MTYPVKKSLEELAIKTQRLVKNDVCMLKNMENGKDTNQKYIPFIGAGVTSVVEESIKVDTLIKQLKDRLIPVWVENKLSKLSQYLSFMGENAHSSHETIASYINQQQKTHTDYKRSEFLKKEDGSDGDIHNPLWALANLPIPIYITTNYDTLLEEYLKDANKNPQTKVSNWMSWFDNSKVTAEENIELLKEHPNRLDITINEARLKLINWENNYTIKNPVVFHLHGVINDFETMVLSDDDYIRFLVNLHYLGKKTSKYPILVLPEEINNIRLVAPE